MYILMTYASYRPYPARLLWTQSNDEEADYQWQANDVLFVTKAYDQWLVAIEGRLLWLFINNANDCDDPSAVLVTDGMVVKTSNQWPSASANDLTKQ